MATMKIMFDSQHNPITPTLLLANRNGNRLGQITNVSSIYISDALNDVPELTFKVSKFNGRLKCHLWDQIVDFKLVYCLEWDTWFEINVELSDGQEIIKAITATALCQSELSQIMIFGTEINTEDDIARDDYEIPTVIYNNENPEASLLDRITEKAPHYKIKHVDQSLKNIQRTFSFDNISIKDALDEIAKEINCLIVYGNELDPSTRKPARTISLYDLNKNCLECGYRGAFTNVCPKCGSSNILNEYGEDTTIFISKDNLTDDITFSTDAGSVKNCFKLEAGDDLMTATIQNCNPNGSSYIYYFSDEMKNDMPNELVNKINAYDSIYAEYQTAHPISINQTFLAEYNQLVRKYKTYNENLIEIQSPILGYSSLMNALYETIDLELYLHDSMMPTYKIADTNAVAQAALLTVSALSPIGIANISAASSATVDSYVLEKAKIIIDARYQVKIKSSSFDKSTNQWSGNFTITNYSDDEDTADSARIKLEITDDFEQYIRQKIDKALSKGDTEDYSISSLLKKNLTASNGTFAGEFSIAIQQYSLQALTSIHDCCQSCLDILVEQGVSDATSWFGSNPNLYETFYLNYYNKIQALEYEMSVRKSEVNKVSALEDAIESARKEIQKALDFKNYIGNDLWEVFCSYRRDDLYNNSNYVSDGLTNAELFDNAREFLEIAEKEIFKSSTLQHSISSTLKNLLVIKEFQKIVDYFAVGNWIRIEVDNSIYKLRLLRYDIDYDDLSNITVEFSDVAKIRDGASDIENVLNQATSMATSYSSVKRQASKGNDTYDILSRWHQDGMSATYAKFMNDADSQDMIFDRHGMLFRKYDTTTDRYLPTQLKIINSTIAISDDNWKSTRTAIGNFIYKDPKTGQLTEAYGINGEVICGKLLLGETLGIYNSSGSLSFNKDGLVITNGKNTFSVNPNNTAKLLALSNKTTDLLYVDAQGKLHIRGDGAGLDISANSTVSGLSTRITANADGLSAEISRATKSEGELSTSIQTNAEGISAEIARAKGVEGNLSTRITANADGLSLRVEKNGVIAAINASSESVSIKANKINLNGAVTANNYFRINTDGSMECTNAKVSGNITASTLTASTSGTIAGWNIGGGGISYDSSSYTVHVLTGTNASKDFLVVYDKTSNTWPFYVHADGTVYSTKLTAVNANISGTITTGNLTATGGKIANFTISGGYLFNGIGIGTAGSCGISCGSSLSGSDDWIFWAGNGVFRVNKNGQAWLSNATISGSITATSLSVKNGIYMYSDSYTSRAVISLESYSTTITDPTIRVGWGCDYMYLGRYVMIDCASGTHGGYVAEISGNSYSIYCAPTIEIPNNHYIRTATKAVNGNATIVPLIGLSGGDNIWIGGDGSDSDPVGNCYIVAKNVYKRSSGSNTSLSDERYKTDIQNITGAEDFIMALSPKMYKFKDGTSERYHTGFLAGKVKEAMDKTIGDFGVYVRYTFNEEVPIDHNNPDTYICGLRYEEIIAPHVQLTQSHHKKILNLENKVTQLEKRIEELERSIA